MCQSEYKVALDVEMRQQVVSTNLTPWIHNSCGRDTPRAAAMQMAGDSILTTSIIGVSAGIESREGLADLSRVSLGS